MNQVFDDDLLHRMDFEGRYGFDTADEFRDREGEYKIDTDEDFISCSLDIMNQQDQNIKRLQKEWREKYNHLHGEYVKTLKKHSENLIKITEYEKKISDQEQIINKLFIKNKKLEKRLNKREKGEYDPIIYKGVSREDFDKLSDIEKEFYESEWEKFVNNGW